MENSNFAAIDIGSNGARLLIKNVIEDAGGNYEFNKVLFLRIPLRLGKDVFTIGEISPERERMMMCMIKSYKQLMKLYQHRDYPRKRGGTPALRQFCRKRICAQGQLCLYGCGRRQHRDFDD